MDTRSGISSGHRNNCRFRLDAVLGATNDSHESQHILNTDSH